MQNAERIAIARDRLMAVLVRSGAERIDPSILQPADIFVDLAGEDIRRRMLTTRDAAGCEQALRPDFTIPTALEHLAHEPAKPARYAYFGPVFRQREGVACEVLQAGVEDFGEEDRAKLDADILLLALRALSALGKRQLSVRIGDKALYSALLASLTLPEGFRRRLTQAFGDRKALARCLADMANAPQSHVAPQSPVNNQLNSPVQGPVETYGAPLDQEVLTTLAGLPEEEARRVASGLVDAAVINSGGVVARKTAEIVDRLMTLRETATAQQDLAKAAGPLGQYLAISSAADKAERDITRLAGDQIPVLAEPAKLLTSRLAHLAENGVPPDHLVFEASFGRPLDYYTGFEFEVYDGNSGERLVGGGRYDQLCTRLGSPVPVSAIGFSIWLDAAEVVDA